MMQAGASLNAALRCGAGNPGIPKGIDKFDYAFAFVALATDPSAERVVPRRVSGIITGRPAEETRRSSQADPPD